MNYFDRILLLQAKSPRAALTIMENPNSDYNMYSAYIKNCYLLVGSERDEDCMYGNWIYDSRDCVDNGFVYKSELLYECVDCEQCYNCNFSQDSTSCNDSSYLYDCKACRKCFGCAGLRNKEFHILNKPVPADEYETHVAKIKTHGMSQFLEEFEKLKQQTPRLFAHFISNENCAGDYLSHCKNCFTCFDGKNLEDCMYLQSSIECKDCMDMSNSYFGCELSYEAMSTLQLYNCNFSNFCYYGTNLEYCEFCFNCKDCFGCFFLQKKQYYIFNEQYTKADYAKKVAEIKEAIRRDGTYGKHLPATIPIEDSAISNYFRTT